MSWAEIVFWCLFLGLKSTYGFRLWLWNSFGLRAQIMSGDSRARSREVATGTNSERTVPASTSSSVEDSSLGTVMDSLNSVNPMKTLDQVDCSDLLVSGVSNQQRQKKSSFQITKVITKNKDDVETADDLDETNTEDVSSGILDLSKMTDADQEPLSADTLHSPGGEEFWPSPASLGKHPLSSTEPKEKVADTHSRFKIVKIESKDRTKKGRWTCMDFADPEHTEKTDDHGTGSSSTSNSIYYIPGATDDQSKSPFAAAIVYNQGHPVLEPNLLKSPLYANDTRFQQLLFFQNSYTGAIQQPISISDPDALSRFREQQLPTPGKMPVISVTAGSLPSGSLPNNLLPTGTMPVGSLPSGTLPTGSISSGSKPVNTLATGTLHTGNLPASTLPASTLTSGTLHSGSMSSVPVPSGSLPGSGGVTGQAVTFAHGGLLPVNEIVGTAQVTASKSVNQLYTSDAGVNSTGMLDDHSRLADGHPIFADSDQRVLAMSGGSKDHEQTLSSKRTSQTSPLLAMVSATIQSSGFAVTDVDEGHAEEAEGEDGPGASAMGAEQRSSPDGGNDFMTSATSFIKGCVLRSLSDDGGTSSVAIDNKIEQAMDLVKSHLMFAVREEVEVLKEQIKELLEKNQRLEYENEILKADATPETLAKLQSGQP